MNEHKSEGAPLAPQTQSGPDLERLSDEQLRAVSDRAEELLREREKQQREDAIKQINAIAKAHGLKVSVQDPNRKRGRPRKAASMSKTPSAS